MKLRFVKTQIQEDDKNKVVKLSFSGKVNDVNYQLSISGYEEDIEKVKQSLKVNNYNEMIDMELKNED